VNSAVGFIFGGGVWTIGSVLTNPADGAVIVDSGPLAGSNYLFSISGASSIDWVYDVQLRDATNANTLFSQRRRCKAGNEDFIFPNKLPMSTNQRLRLVLVGAIVGELQMSIFNNEVG
jgi:hypothetical protein